jgi:hypothetical protein
MLEEKKLTEKESLDLITMMINKAKESRHETGTTAIMWGIIITVCSLEKLAEIQFGFRLPFDIYLITFLAVIPQVIIKVREKKRRKVTTYDDIYMGYIWLAFGISIFLMIFITNAIFAAWEPLNDNAQIAPANGFYEFIAPLFLLLYGFPTFVTGAACRFKPMLFGGIFCWVCCIATIYTTIKIDLLLIAASAIFAWLVPGIIMERDYRRAKKGLAQSDV